MLFKKDQKFFPMFTDMTQYILQAVDLLGVMVKDPSVDIQQLSSQIKDLEHKGDDVTHRVIEELNKTFITPIDREDIHDLCLALDDVLDLIDSTAGRIVLYQLTGVISGIPEMWTVLQNQARQIDAAVKRLRDSDHVIEHCIEINRLENDADRIFQMAIGSLFEQVKDPIEVIKRKEIIEMVERATDKAEDVANVLETIVVKNA